MSFLKRLFVLLLGLTVFFNPIFSFANELKYSFGPRCNGNNLVCDEHEEPVCLVIDPSVHFEDSGNNNEAKQYLPTCNTWSNPTCIDLETGEMGSGNVIVECIEFVKCEISENQNEKATCSDNKTARCLGHNNELNGCNCSDGTDPVCDWTWDTSTISSK